jgi:hypothetical protein
MVLGFCCSVVFQYLMQFENKKISSLVKCLIWSEDVANQLI